MRRSERAVFYAAVLAGLAVLTGVAGYSAMAQTNSGAGPTSLLVAPATVRGIEPARLQIILSAARIPPRAQLELTVEPISLSNERYIVVVSLAGDVNKQLGSFSFFPPPHLGETQVFLVNAQPLIDQRTAAAGNSPIDLTVQLAPVTRGNTLANASIRILSAKLIGG